MSIFVLSPATYYLLPLTVLKDVNVSSLSGSDFTPPGTTPPPPPPVGTLQFSVPTFSVNEDGTTIAAVTLTRTDWFVGYDPNPLDAGNAVNIMQMDGQPTVENFTFV